VRGPVWLIRPTATNAGPADSANASKLEWTKMVSELHHQPINWNVN
jgi:hypothetical protein